MNNGACFLNGSNAFSCTCQSQYNGELCQNCLILFIRLDIFKFLIENILKNGKITFVWIKRFAWTTVNVLKKEKVLNVNVQTVTAENVARTVNKFILYNHLNQVKNKLN